eukprot:scaffold6136_cov56-Phaeocystis_antarctica.AAC.3
MPDRAVKAAPPPSAFRSDGGRRRSGVTAGSAKPSGQNARSRVFQRDHRHVPTVQRVGPADRGRHQAGRFQVETRGIRLHQRDRGWEDRCVDIGAFGDFAVAVAPVRADSLARIHYRYRRVVRLLGRLLDPRTAHGEHHHEGAHRREYAEVGGARFYFTKYRPVLNTRAKVRGRGGQVTTRGLVDRGGTGEAGWRGGALA